MKVILILSEIHSHYANQRSTKNKNVQTHEENSRNK